MNVKDKVAIVTGASSGIGKATAVLLAQKGARVVLASRSRVKLQKLSEELKNSLVYVTDMRVESQIKKMVRQTVKKYGRIDILVNNAGRGYDSLVEKINLKLFKELFQLNLLAPLIAMQAVLPVMKKQKSGSIVNISSGTSLMNIPGIAAYSSLKRALNALSLAAREELSPDNINISVVYPYITATNFGDNVMGGRRRWQPSDEDRNLPPPDSADYLAGKILEAIETGKGEIFAHGWMGKRS